MHRRSALQPAGGPCAGARCLEDSTALATSRAQGRDPERRVVASLQRSRAGCLRTTIAPGQPVSGSLARSFGSGTLAGARRHCGHVPAAFGGSQRSAGARRGQSPVKWRRSDHVSVPGLPQPITVSSQPNSYTQNVFTVPFSLSYEADLFGRVRHNVEAANASLQSTAADLQNVQLVLTAELAADYFTLRELDAEFEVVQESVGYQRKGLDLVNNRHTGGIASGLEVAQQAALLDSTLSQLALVQQIARAV